MPLAVWVASALVLLLPSGNLRQQSRVVTGDCGTLAALRLRNARVASATVVPKGGFELPNAPRDWNVSLGFTNLPSFCRVTAVLTPTKDSAISVELWLPVEGWNGRFQGVGNGGWGGSIPHPALVAPLAAGYATAITDSGHIGGQTEFAVGHPEKLIDFGYRAIHEMAVQSKLIVRAFYGVGPKYSYFAECSGGGRQGLASAERYPDDFNGIVAAAPVLGKLMSHAGRVALNLFVNRNSAAVIPSAKYPAINAAVLRACDATDGVTDGVIENPAACRFDYASLRCSSGDASDCLTAEQIESAKAMTSPVRDPKSGAIAFGGLAPGAELRWSALGGPSPLAESTSPLRDLVFRDAAWDYRTFSTLVDFDRVRQADERNVVAVGPDLRRFMAGRGKLLIYQGWNDPVISPIETIDHYQAVVKRVGDRAADQSMSLFMVPGMNHCSGGTGTDRWDPVKIVEAWVERGERPTRIVASRVVDGRAVRTRPLCPYPQTARYQGGNPDAAESFSCLADGASAARD